MNRFLAFVILLFCFQSCKTGKLDADLSDLGTDFYPVEKGIFSVYDVNVTEFLSSGPQHRFYQVKELIKDTLHLSGEVIYRLERFYRNDSLREWKLQPDSVWTLRKNAYNVLRTENNIRFLRLAFPVREGKTWDGNAHNIFSKEEYRIRKLGRSFSTGAKHYPQTLHVLHSGDSSLLGKDYREEVFAKDVGLVYKVTEKIEYRNVGGVVGTDTTGGILYYQKLREYGKE
ncbi:hypothetical protein RCC89_14270 [Cytophagaceae bacterium ABcell3]|nr:hypothetical protein RCC89_14270 [Cytophagaceae bacterium ABcell3]